MKIVRDQSSKTVRYVLADTDECAITATGMTGVIHAADIFSGTHEVVENIPFIPPGWTGGEWIYDGLWQRNDGKTLLEQRLAELASLRYEKEIAGIMVNGAAIATDRASQALITGAWSISQINPSVLIDWKTASGVWVQIDAATIAGIAAMVAAHVQTCFSAERVHAEALAALTTSEAVAAYDLTTGWPG